MSNSTYPPRTIERVEQSEQELRNWRHLGFCFIGSRARTHTKHKKVTFKIDEFDAEDIHTYGLERLNKVQELKGSAHLGFVLIKIWRASARPKTAF
ncbi:hypothetical protein AVEN_76788-1 [Araneus ventricosus]|uniref:Uncharacterized protein n=1 Tax=Araneus ventricosus TaxID=182803 RepID=A0A4Y2WBF8_ARAVE|nr:hypothetical protein AVEN_76788-1 [Araneus ventricosus]